MNFIQVIASLLIFLLIVSCRQDTPKSKHDHFEPISTVLENDPYRLKSNELIKNTFDTLKSTLLKAIETDNIQTAIGVCNLKAAALTSAYLEDGMEIRRTSNRYRNPENAPTALEKTQLDYLKKMALQNIDITESLISDVEGNTHYFKSIFVQPLCLNCHGSPEQHIMPSTVAKLDELYPSDNAKNYRENEFRGVWHVTFDRDYKLQQEN